LALPGEKHDNERNGHGAPDPAPHFFVSWFSFSFGYTKKQKG
jgi:hypothetical protein